MREREKEKEIVDGKEHAYTHAHTRTWTKDSNGSVVHQKPKSKDVHPHFEQIIFTCIPQIPNPNVAVSI